MKYISILLLVFLLNSCQENIDVKYKVLNLNSAVKQMKEKGITNEMIFKDKKLTSLNDSEIRLLNEILVASIDTYNKKRSPENLINVSEYRFYFVPTLDDSDKKWVFIQGSCLNEEENWPEYTEFYFTEDGGKCNIRTAINLTDKFEGWIIINSKA